MNSYHRMFKLPPVMLFFNRANYISFSAQLVIISSMLPSIHGSSQESDQHRSQSPNLIVIMADDVGWDVSAIN